MRDSRWGGEGGSTPPRSVILAPTVALMKLVGPISIKASHPPQASSCHRELQEFFEFLEGG